MCEFRIACSFILSQKDKSIGPLVLAEFIWHEKIADLLGRLVYLFLVFNFDFPILLSNLT